MIRVSQQEWIVTGVRPEYIVYLFLKHLVKGLREIDKRARPENTERIFDELYRYLVAHIPFFPDAYHGLEDTGQQAALSPPRSALLMLVRVWFYMKTRYPVLQRANPVKNILKSIAMALASRVRGPSPVADGSQNEAKQQARPGATVLRAVASLTDGKLEKLARSIVDMHPSVIRCAADVCNELAGASDADRAVVFLTLGFPTSWAPFASALTQRLVRTQAVCLYDYTQSLETGVLNTNEIPVTKTSVLDFLGHLLLLGNRDNSSILINSDSYFQTGWDPEKVTQIYMLAAAMMAAGREARAGRGKIVAFKYDALQPVLYPDSEAMDLDPEHTLLGDFYREHLKQSDAIIYNANSELMGGFLENVVALQQPRIHFYRYASQPSLETAKLDWKTGKSIHLVVLTRFLSDYDDHTRNHFGPLVAAIIRQKINVHYFCDVSHPVVEQFATSLGPDFREYLHPHPTIRDQRDLVDAIQPFHFGLVLSDESGFLRSMSSLRDNFYRDATSLMWQSTIPSAPFVMAAAGLPFVCPRYMLGLQQIFDEIALPMTASELINLRMAMERWDMPRRMALAHGRRHLFWMETNISRVTDFLAV